MVTIYSYKPESADSTSKAISFGVLGGAGALVLLSEILPEYKPVLQTAGFILALFGVLFCSRFLLSSYTYIIESAADGGWTLVRADGRRLAVGKGAWAVTQWTYTSDNVEPLFAQYGTQDIAASGRRAEDGGLVVTWHHLGGIRHGRFTVRP